MNKGFTILLLSTYLLTTTGLGQLLNLPQLVVHYFTHKKLDREITLWNYLANHYAESKDDDDDESEDRKLPFKTINNAYFYSIATNEPVESVTIKQPAFLPLSIQHYSNHTNFQQLLISRSIWHPPKLLTGSRFHS